MSEEDENERRFLLSDKKVKLDRRTKKTLNAIYLAVKELFKEKNLGEITMEEIAERANISRATLYNYFKSKAEVYFQICYESFKKANKLLARAKYIPKKGFDIIMLICSETFKRISQDPLDTRIIYLLLLNENFQRVNEIADKKLVPKEVEQLLGSPEIGIMVKLLEQLRTYEELWAEVVTKGMADGSITTTLEPIQLVHYLLILITGVLDQMLLKKYMLQKFNLTYEMIFEKTLSLIEHLLHDNS